VELSVSVTSSYRLFARSPTRPRPPQSTPFPYTTLFRSRLGSPRSDLGSQEPAAAPEIPASEPVASRQAPQHSRGACLRERRRGRSEEHTSELQSRENLVCRLLLEKKKIARNISTTELTE